MLTRRFLLAGASLLAFCMPLAALPATEPAVRAKAFDIVEAKILESLRRVKEERGGYFTLMGARASEWLHAPDLRARLSERLKLVWNDPAFQLAKESFGSILSEEGRLHVGAQWALAEHFPIVPDLMDRELFEAFTVFAPKHLLESPRV